MEEIEFPKDVNGFTVKVGDKVKGEGFLYCYGGFKIDLSPVVTVRLEDNIVYFGALSASSFFRFWIVN